MNEQQPKAPNTAAISRRVAVEVALAFAAAIIALAALGWAITNWSTILDMFSFHGHFWGTACLNMTATAIFVWAYIVLGQARYPGCDRAAMWRFRLYGGIALTVCLLSARALGTTYLVFGDFDIYQQIAATTVYGSAALVILLTLTLFVEFIFES